MFNRFSREARRCVEHAMDEARMLGHDSVGTKDLLLGTLSGDSIAYEALRSLGVTLEAAREESRGMFQDALGYIGISLDAVRDHAGEGFETGTPTLARLPFSPGAKKSLEQALREGLRLGDSTLTGEHILRGVLRDESGPAARLLQRFGVSVREVEEQLDQLRAVRP